MDQADNRNQRKEKENFLSGTDEAFRYGGKGGGFQTPLEKKMHQRGHRKNKRVAEKIYKRIVLRKCLKDEVFPCQHRVGEGNPRITESER